MFYVYFLKSLIRSEYYIGLTGDLRRRFKEHNNGKSPATKRYRPWQLVYYEAFCEEPLARMREHNLKHNGNAIHELKKRLHLGIVAESKSKTIKPGTPIDFRQSGAGFTLAEILISIGILGVLGAMVISSYSRGSGQSALQKETALLMGRLRLAQEQTASGSQERHCTKQGGNQCLSDADCDATISDNTCALLATPPGGHAILVSCDDMPSPFTGEVAHATYFHYGHTAACATTGTCFPPQWNAGVGWSPGTDGIISSYGTFAALYGDALIETFALDEKVEIRDIRLWTLNTSYQCSDGTPWEGKAKPGYAALPAEYPLQVLITYLPPDGRRVAISDNIASGEPDGGSPVQVGRPWVRADILLRVRTKNVCTVVSVNSEGILSSRADADCNV